MQRRVVEWLPLAEPGTPFPPLIPCSSVAVIGGSAEHQHDLVEALRLQGLALQPSEPGLADLIICLHDSPETGLMDAFTDLSAQAGRSSLPRVVVAVARTGSGSAGLAGLVKTAALEWSAAWKCISLEAELPIADAVAAELARGGSQREVRLLNQGQRAVCIRVAHDPLSANTPRRPLSLGPWLITGGGRGVTAACALALAQAGARQFVLMGRSSLEAEPPGCEEATDEASLKRALIAAAGGKPDLRAIGRQVAALLGQREIRATMAAIEQAGGQVRYASADVTDASAVARLTAEVRAEWGPIRALIHGAGVLADKRLGEKTAEQFAAVLRPKLAGVQALLEACRDDPLEQICFFSSVAAHSGNAGQSDYAAANGVLDALAVEEQARRGSACHVVSTAWGPWAGGMVNPSLAKHFQARGIGLIPEPEGAQALVTELCCGEATQVVLGCGLEPLSEPSAEILAVDLARWPFLDGHRIDKDVVLPMTLALDLLMGAGRLSFGPACTLTDLRLLQGLVLREAHAELEIRTSTEPAQPGERLSLVHRSGRPAYQALVLPGETELPPAAEPLHEGPADDLQPLCLDPYDEALFHGPPFQVIRQVLACRPDGIRARLATAAAMGWPGQWQLDPAALDGALQLLRLWGMVQGGGPSLPTAIGRCRPWSAWPLQGEVGCRLHCRRDNAFRLSGDALFVDLERGEPLLSLDGIVMHIQGS